MEWQETRASEALAKAPADARVAVLQWTESVDTAGQELILNRGYRAIRRSWRMEIALAEEPGPVDWPDGVAVRTFVPEKDVEGLDLASREAFRDHWGYLETPLDEDMRRTHHRMTDPGFDPSVWFLAVAGEEIVGMSLARLRSEEDPQLAWINTVGVRSQWRRRGIAHALLRHSFRELYQRGKRRVALGVDSQSLTGATRVYERAGMKPVRTWVVFEKELRPGKELATTTLSRDE